MKGITHDLIHDLTFYCTHNQLCVPQYKVNQCLEYLVYITLDKGYLNSKPISNFFLNKIVCTIIATWTINIPFSFYTLWILVTFIHARKERFFSSWRIQWSETPRFQPDLLLSGQMLVTYVHSVKNRKNVHQLLTSLLISNMEWLPTLQKVGKR